MEKYDQHFEHGRLIVRYLTDQLTEEEREQLEQWIAESEENQALFSKLTDARHISAGLKGFVSSDKSDAWKRIAAETGVQGGHFLFRRSFLRVGAAAMILIAAGTIAFWGWKRTGQPTRDDTARHAPAGEITPGRDVAVLTLADGSQILLDEVSEGEIAKQENTSITKTQDGQLIYSQDEKSSLSPSGRTHSYNTISVPRGGQYRIVLPDGSTVWLNAASTLKYPTRFSQLERKVELVGEAYFEVSKVYQSGRREAIPFRVFSEGQRVEVLGTRFNVNSYSDEQSIKTTLVEGSVKVVSTTAGARSDGQRTATESEVMLRPGEQAQLKPNGKRPFDLIRKVDTEEVVAWKNGQFQFKEADLYTIMRQISRWYDVEVEFQGKPSDIKYRGKISRDVSIDKLFQILQTNGVNFKIQGRKIIVST